MRQVRQQVHQVRAGATAGKPPVQRAPSETSPGGAGAAKKIAENVGVVVESAVKRVTDCDCGEETSCYGCLRTYRNARDHEKLSRRAALRLLHQ